MQELIDKIQELVAFELARANTIHPPRFNSMHEAYAVIKEELDEVKDQYEAAERDLDIMWMYVKSDEVGAAETKAQRMEKTVIKLAAEAIQVAAMCRKARM